LKFMPGLNGRGCLTEHSSVIPIVEVPVELSRSNDSILSRIFCAFC